MRILSCRVFPAENAGKTVWGVEVRAGEEVFSFPCISAERREAETLAGRLNGEDLDVCQLSDVVRDYLTEQHLNRLLQNGIAG